MSSDTHPGPPPATAPAAGSAGEESPSRRRWYAFAVVLTASVMDVLDSLITTVAGPSIRADVGGSTTVIQWLTAGYTLAMAAGLIIGGRLGDIYGRKRMFMTGVAGFTLLSVLCGLAEGSTALIGFRVLQGLFGAVLIPQGLGLIKDIFPVRELPLAFGTIGPVMGLATIAGPLLGGWLIGADLFGTGWRMIFLINLPVGLAALAAAAKLLPSGRERTASRLDLPGAVLVAVAAVLMVFPVVQGRELGWPAWTFVSIAASVLLFVLFGRYEKARQRAGRDCLVIPDLFRKRAFSGTLVAGALLFSAVVGFSLVLTLYIQTGLGRTPFDAALYSLPQVLGSSVIALVAGRAGLAVKLGRKLIHIGTAGLFAGTGALYLTVRLTGQGVDPLWFGPSLIVIGVGMGLAMSALYFTVNTAAEPHESGSASGTFTAVQQFAGALGVAVIGTLFFGLLGGATGAGGAGHAAAGQSFGGAFEGVLLVLAGMYAVTFGMAFLVPRARGSFGPGPGAPAAADAAAEA